MANLGDLILTIKAKGDDDVIKRLRSIETASQRAAKAMDSARGPGNSAEVAERNAQREMATSDKAAAKAIENAQKVEMARIRSVDKAFEAQEKAIALASASAEKAASDEIARRERIAKIPISFGGGGMIGPAPKDMSGPGLFPEQKGALAERFEVAKVEVQSAREMEASAARLAQIRRADAEDSQKRDRESYQMKEDKIVTPEAGEKAGKSFVGGFRTAFRTFAMGAMAADFAASVGQAIAVGLTTTHGIIGKIAAAEAIPIVGGIVKAAGGISDAMSGQNIRDERMATADRVYQLEMQTRAAMGDQFTAAEATARAQHEGARVKLEAEVAANQISRDNMDRIMKGEDELFNATRKRIELSKTMEREGIENKTRAGLASADAIVFSGSASAREDALANIKINQLKKERVLLELDITDSLRDQHLAEKDAQIEVEKANNGLRIRNREFQRDQSSGALSDEIKGVRLLMDAKRDEAEVTELQSNARREAARLEREGDINGARLTKELANEKVKLIKIEQDRAKALAEGMLDARQRLISVDANTTEGDRRRLDMTVQIEELEARIAAERKTAAGSAESQIRLNELQQEKQIREAMMAREIELDSRRLAIQRQFANSEVEAIQLRMGHQAAAATEIEAKANLEKKIAEIKLTARKDEQAALIQSATAEYEARAKSRTQEKREKIDDIRAQTAMNLMAASGMQTTLQSRLIAIREDFRRRERDAGSDDERKALRKLEQSEESKAIRETLQLKTVGSQEAKFTAFLGGNKNAGGLGDPILSKQLDALHQIEMNTRNSIARAA